MAPTGLILHTLDDAGQRQVAGKPIAGYSRYSPIAACLKAYNPIKVPRTPSAVGRLDGP